MIYDAYTVAWKELKLLSQGGSGSKWLPLIFLGAFGVLMPWQMGEVWLETPAGVAFLAIIPLILIGSWVADAVAGERERHTLETLLASRLSDRSILLGKIGAAVAYGWCLALIIYLAGVVAANAGYWTGAFRFYAPVVAIAGLGFSLAFALFAASAGTLISLRASTVRQAQQIVGFGVMALVWLPSMGLTLLPDSWKERLGALLQGIDPIPAVLITLAALLVLDLLLFLAALARFQRPRLLLD